MSTEMDAEGRPVASVTLGVVAQPSTLLIANWYDGKLRQVSRSSGGRDGCPNSSEGIS